MDRTAPLEFSYPALFRDLIWFWLIFLGIIILIIDAAAIFGLHSVYTSNRGTMVAYFQPTLVSGVGVWMTLLFFHWVRHRRAFQTRYVLRDESLLIEPFNGIAVSIAWSEFDSGVECRLCRYVLLSGPKVKVAVVLTFGAKGGPAVPPSDKWAMSLRLIGAKLGPRLVRRWC